MLDHPITQAIELWLPRPRKLTPSGWHSFNCPCCQYRGEPTPDTKGKAGIHERDGGFVINCHRCRVKVWWAPGQMLNDGLKYFFRILGMPPRDVQVLEFRAWQLRETNPNQPTQYQIWNPEFPEVSLPEGARNINDWLSEEEPPGHLLDGLGYWLGRGASVVENTEAFWTPNRSKSMCDRIIIPFYFRGKLVGYTGRDFTGEHKERYMASCPPEFMYNADLIYDRNRPTILVTEGILDGVAISAVATMGNRLTENQARWLMSTGKKIVVVPDREKSGEPLVDAAMKYGWEVSFPMWESGIKDAAAACAKYGRIWTLWSIFQDNHETPSKGIRTTNQTMIKVMRSSTCQ